jgi:hypothetical protein
MLLMIQANLGGGGNRNVGNSKLYSESLGFWILSIIQYSKNNETMFQQLDLFLSSGKGREIPTLLGSLEGANLSQSF